MGRYVLCRVLKLSYSGMILTTRKQPLYHYEVGVCSGITLGMLLLLHDFNYWSPVRIRISG